MMSSEEGTGKKVRFLTQNDVIYVWNRQEISEGVKAGIWFMDKERDGIKHSILKTVKIIRMNGSKVQRCIRGIEQFIYPEVSEQRQINKDCVFFAVLKEQDRQRSLGISDPEELRNASEMASQWARNLAERYAAEDAIEANLDINAFHFR